jgi:ELP3 family radical SAM enzyme/protein acetyltransferase
MQKILTDLEDFVLPEQKPDIEKDADTNSKIDDILVVFHNYCKKFQNTQFDDNTNYITIRKDFTSLYNKQLRINKLNVQKRDFILNYKKLIKLNILPENTILDKMLCKKPSRTISGITSITLVMSPYPHGQSFSCQHNCYYCPNEPAHKGNQWQAQPRSYLYHEPAVRRANRNQFKAYEQMIDRMDCLFTNGHTIDKLEIIVEGGTYTEYPELYLEEFNRDTYYAANTYFDIEKRPIKSLQDEIVINRTAKVHIIGICIETRPDAMNDNWIRHFRKCGVTRIQLGVQSTHNHILKKINRGHDIECAVKAIEMLKNLAFKIDIHIMPDLPYSTPELDKQMFDFTYSILQPDQIKVYPCAVVPWTIIEKWYNKGVWKPYEPDVLKDVMDYAMTTCPDWIRLPRVIRDIPGLYIQAGNKTTNLRQLLSTSREIRSREIERHPQYYNTLGKIFVECYNNKNNIKDYFISYESYDKKALFGFLRLRLPDKNNKTATNIFNCLNDAALIRELHVYGFNTAVGKNPNASQHTGIGSKLLNTAENISYIYNYKGIVVISGEGVKDYYHKRGYYEIDTYMKKYFNLTRDVINITIYLFIITTLIVIAYSYTLYSI